MQQPHAQVQPGVEAATHPHQALSFTPAQQACIHVQVEQMVEAANRFAERHLTEMGISCYFGRLLHRYSQLAREAEPVPPNATLFRQKDWHFHITIT